MGWESKELTGASIQANETRMKSYAGTYTEAKSSNPAVAQKALEGYVSAFTDKLKLEGREKSLIDEEVRIGVSGVMSDTVRFKMSNGDTAEARKLFDGYVKSNQLTVKDQTDLNKDLVISESAVKVLSTVEESLVIGDKNALAPMVPNKEMALSHIQQKYAAGEINKEEATAARIDIQSRYTARDNQINAAQKSLQDSASLAIYNGESVAAYIARNPQQAPYLDILSLHKITPASQVAEPDYVYVTSLNAMLTSNPNTFSEMKLEASQLGKDYTGWLEKQANVKNGKHRVDVQEKAMGDATDATKFAMAVELGVSAGTEAQLKRAATIQTKVLDFITQRTVDGKQPPMDEIKDYAKSIAKSIGDDKAAPIIAEKLPAYSIAGGTETEKALLATAAAGDTTSDEHLAAIATVKSWANEVGYNSEIGNGKPSRPPQIVAYEAALDAITGDPMAAREVREFGKKRGYSGPVLESMVVDKLQTLAQDNKKKAEENRVKERDKATAEYVKDNPAFYFNLFK
jgi:hypothetical protein